MELWVWRGCCFFLASRVLSRFLMWPKDTNVYIMHHAFTQSKGSTKNQEYLGCVEGRIGGVLRMSEKERCRKRNPGVKEAGRKKIYHGILLRDTLVLSCLLIKALICLAEGKEAGMCADIIAKLKAMPSGRWASTMLYLQELPDSVAHHVCFFIFLIWVLQLWNKRWRENRHFAKDVTSHMGIDCIHHPNYLVTVRKDKLVPLVWHLRQLGDGLCLAARTNGWKIKLQLLFNRTALVEGHLSLDWYIFR